ncbi:mannose-6-phosphate isomerase, class I [Microbacterium aurantiacum]|uniref:mannose-6-phosphate isomerase n=1 Tax=Microbacterium aurantiacum TaxID=162393 RepID=A0AAJ2HEU6_9MICO|nr:mannose-6-phosphate isomerase, class I [Microbacterium aurantiacum]MDS0244861.1 mannose-6-phosphate isomerase, class I [Microbacterium aurantiacum]
MLRLFGHSKNYSWGSPDAIPRFIGTEPTDEPLAELWFGAHSSGPTLTDDESSLSEHIARDVDGTLGPDVAQRFSHRLPYLVKLLAPASAVSLQVHPNATYAAAGYAAEQREQVEAANRTFSDAFHKPEMLFAVTPFEGLIGFRDLEAIQATLARFTHPALRPAADLIRRSPADLKEAFGYLSRLGRDDVAGIVQESSRVGSSHDDSVAGISALAAQYPGDPGVVASVLLDRVVLAPGDAAFVPSGVVHSYRSGLAVEVMANSDNVFRAGLTRKRVSLPQVLDNLLTDPPRVFRAPGDGTASYDIDPGTPEFAISHIWVDGDHRTLPAFGPKLVLCLNGEVSLVSRSGEIVLTRGRAAFIPHADGAVSTQGAGSVIVVRTPAARDLPHEGGSR